jgi:hypothetical protein
MSRMLARTLPISCWSELPAASEAQMCVMRSLKLDASELEEPGQQQQQQQQHGQIRAGVDLPVKKPGQQAAGAAGSWAGRICQLGGAICQLDDGCARTHEPRREGGEVEPPPRGVDAIEHLLRHAQFSGVN